MSNRINNVDVLSLVWMSSPHRDGNMSSLTCNYLKMLGLSVQEGSLFNGYYLIDKYKPKILFLANTTGSIINHDIMKYASNKGIIGISLVSEGNIKDRAVKEMVWGWNKDFVFYEQKQLHWSENARDIAVENFPEIKPILKVSGGVGFDIYKILPPISKHDFLLKYSKHHYKKVIGIGLWDFSHLYPDNSRFQLVKGRSTKEEIDFLRNSHLKFNDLLKKTIAKNKDVLFLLKIHPGSSGKYFDSGIEGCDKLINSLIIHNEEPLADCISISDFWAVFDSTTALEAWLLGKNTCLLNPLGTNFYRDDIYKGSPNYKDDIEFQNAIINFYQNKILSNYEDLIKIREDIIKKTIQWDDGLNHIRVGNEIIDSLKDNSPHLLLNLIKPSFRIKKIKSLLYWHLAKFGFFILPLLKANMRIYHSLARRRFDEKELKDYNKSILWHQKAFYRENNLTIEGLFKIKCS